MSVHLQGAALSKPPPPHATGAHLSDKSRRFENRRFLLWSILVAVCLGALIDWFSADTQRLYVDEDSSANQQEGTVWQHFGVRGNEVVPEIVSQDEARFSFPISLRTSHSLFFTAHPVGSAEYEIVWRTAGTSHPIAGSKIDRVRSENISLPAGQGELKFIVHGRIAWFDLRLARKFYWPVYLGAFLLVALALKKPGTSRSLSTAAGNWLVLGASTLICLGIFECVLRAAVLKLPPAILNARHDLGLSAPDPRWIDSPRYRQRLRPNLKTYCEWQHGDIVRMGFISPQLFGGENHRYPFETDAEGFRNPAVRQEIDVAALGDSFVDGMTSPAEETWPARLEQITGKKVQNYGTSSFGPQQELHVLQDYAIRHKPRHVVLGLFAGNDFFDAERFDRWKRGGGNQPGEEPTGWRLQKKFRRYEALFLTTLARVALPSGNSQKEPPRASPSAAAVPRFDRGSYEIPGADGAVLRFAFMPPYLQKLADARPEIERSRGWEFVRATLLEMREICRQQQSRLTVMFIPPKDEVYWPLVEHSLGQEELQRSIDFACSYNHMHVRTADIRANRLAHNELLRDFCAEHQISFLDLTPALERNAAVGRAVYFADDAHWNAAGHEIAAEELAKFLGQEP
jgi:hypothetical protein